MSNLTIAINNLATACKKVGLPFGDQRDQHLVLSSDIPTNASLKEWLIAIGQKDLEVRWTFEWLTIYGAGDLVDRQIGYRWLTDDHNKTADGWKDDWLVIGDCGGDAIIANMSKEDVPILYAVHGIGEWKPQEIASCFADFLMFLTVWVQAVGGKSSIDLRNQDGEFRRDLLNEIRESLIIKLESHKVDILMSFIEEAI